MMAGAMKAGGRPSLHFGSMTFAWSQASSFVDDTVAAAMLERFSAAGGVSFDTARIYAGGKSEEMAGRILPAGELGRRYTVATKAHPSQADGLSPGGLRAQLTASLAALQVDNVPIFYLHQPDTSNPLAETLETANALVNEVRTAGRLQHAPFAALPDHTRTEMQRIIRIPVRARLERLGFRITHRRRPSAV